MNYPVTIMYVENLEALGYFYQYLNAHLKGKQYVPIGSQVPENRVFGQYHTEYTCEMKTHILKQLSKENPKIRLILATIALGIGLNAPNVSHIIHCRPPTTIEKYFQEIGRCGRSGQPSMATMYYNNNDLSKNRKGMTEEMADLCRSKSCLRVFILNYFGFAKPTIDLPKDKCCSVCAAQC